MELVEIIQHVNIIRQTLTDDGKIPNNGLLPLLIYQKAIHVPENEPGKTIRELFGANGWTNAWENGVYDYHHYHSTAHEVLGIIAGSARVQFGGPSGIAILLDKGDAVVIPAGVAHKAIDLYDNFACVGAYPAGQEYDIRYGEVEERDEALKAIRELPLPGTDPIYGIDGPLMANWTK